MSQGQEIASVGILRRMDYLQTQTRDFLLKISGFQALEYFRISPPGRRGGFCLLLIFHGLAPRMGRQDHRARIFVSGGAVNA